VVVVERGTLEHGGDMNFTFEFGELLKFLILRTSALAVRAIERENERTQSFV
jgi:hypothetical protein